MSGAGLDPKKLAGIVGRWIAGCADDGFDAVELDNLDSFTRSRQLIERADTAETGTGAPSSPPSRSAS